MGRLPNILYKTVAMRLFAAVASILIFSCPNLAHAYSPSTECSPNVRSISVTAGGTIDWTTSSSMDLSGCSVFGLSGVSVMPSHGSLPNVNQATGNATGQIRYVNSNDGATSDTFTVLDDSNGTVTYNVTITAAAPTATTGSASSISATGATLNGTVNDNGATTTVTFDYGTTTGYGTNVSATTGGTVSSGSGSTAVAVTLSGLTCNTTYHFRVKGVSSGGTTNGNDASFTTSKCPQTITFNNPGAQNFGTTPTLSATSTSGLTVAFSSSTTGVCTITSGGALTFVSAGTCTINANQAGDSTYAPATQVTQSFAVSAVVPGAPTIGTATAGDTQASVTFTAPVSNGGAAITGYTVTSSPGGFTGTGAASPVVVTGLTNGTAYTFTVTATNSAGTGAASSASNSVTPKASQTITFNNPGAQNFGTTPTLTATSTSSLTVAFSSSTTGVCTITSGGALTFVTAGTCTINADQAGNGTYAPATTVTQSFSVNAVVPGAPTIGTATAGNTQASVAFTAPASNGGAAITGYTVTSNPGGFTGTGVASPITVTGLTNGTAYTFTVTATNSAGTGAASVASNSVTPKASQTITFNNPGAQNFGTVPTLTATADSGLTVSFTSSTTGVCTITSGGALTFVSTGTCTINADQAGNGSYLAATTVTRSFSVNAVVPGAPTIGTASAGDTQASVSFTAPAFTGGATITGYTVTSNPGGLTGTGVASPIIVSGLTNGVSYTFTVTATNSAGTGSASAASNSVTPNPGPAVVSVAVPANGTYGTGQNLDFTVTWDSNTTVTGTPRLALTIGSTNVQANYVSSPTATTTLFRYTVLSGQNDSDGITVGALTLNGGTIQNSNGTDATLTLNSVASTTSVLVNTSAPGAPTIGTATAGDTQATVTFTAPAPNGSTSITTYTATASPGGATGTCAGPAACTITVNGLTNGTAYTFTVTATNVSGTGTASAASNSVTPKGAQTITFNNPGAQNFGTSPTLTATSTSGLTPSFTSSTTGVCTITSGGALTFVTAGTCTINADQAGNGTYAAATTVSRSFAVNAVVPGAPTIGTATPGDTQASITFTAPASNGGASITGYTVTSSPGGATGTGVSSPIIVTGLTNGTAYTFTVTATNSAGTGSASTASNSTTPTSTQTITFNNPGAQNFGTTPTLTATASSGLTVTFTSSTTSVCTITSGGALTFVTAGTCTINANQAGNGAYTAATQVSRSFAVNAVVPGAPTAVTAATGNTQATVSFTAPAFTGGASITGYTVTASPGGATASAAASPIIVTGLTNGTAYTFTVTATNSAGSGSASTASNAVTPIGNQTIIFANPGAQNFGTTPTLTATATSGLTVAFTSSTTGVCTITSGGALTFVTAGTCTINANQAGNGAYTAAPQVSQTFTVNGIAPGAPTIGTVTGGNAQATVAFTAPSSTGGSPITGYIVTASPGGATASGTSSPITVTGLTNGTAYTFTVKATNATGTGTSSSASSSVTPAGLPGAPTSVTAVPGNTSATITFTAPASNGGAAITTYTATSSPGGLTGSCAGPAACTITVNGLTNGTAYTFTVTATNSVGTSAASAASNSVTFIAVPTAGAASMTTTLNTPVSLDLASSITGTGITGINVTVAAKHGATSVSGTQVTYTPVNNYFGTDTFSYVAVSGTGTSAAAVVTVTISGRPDPSKDANVVSLATTQIETVRSFWRAQISNFQQRMEALHHPVRHDADASDSQSPSFAQKQSANRLGSANFAQINAHSARDAQANGSLPAISSDDGTSKFSSAFAGAVMGQINAQNARAAQLNNPYAPAYTGAPQSQSALVTSLVTALMPNGVSIDASDPGNSAINLNLAALNGGKGKPDAMPVDENEVWAGGNVRIGSKKTEDGSQKIDYTTKGVSLGIDRRFTNDLTLGMGLGYAHDNSTIGTDGTGSTSSGSSVAGYGSYQIGSAFVDGMLGFGQMNLNTTRYVASASDFARAGRSGNQTFASLSTGYEYFKFNALISPYARYDYAVDHLNDATETGAGLAALKYNAQTATSQQLSFGLRAETQRKAGFGLMMPRGRVEYQHHIDGGNQATVSYADLVNTQYTITTPTVNSDAILLGLGSGFMLRNNMKLDLDYQFLHSSMQENSHALFIRLWYHW